MRHRRHDRCGPRLQPVWNFRQPACRPPSSKALACSPHATHLKSKLQPQKSSEWRGGLLGRLDSHELSKKVAGFAQRLDRWNNALLFVWSYETIWSSEDVLVYVLLPGLFHRCIPAVSFFSADKLDLPWLSVLWPKSKWQFLRELCTPSFGRGSNPSPRAALVPVFSRGFKLVPSIL